MTSLAEVIIIIIIIIVVITLTAYHHHYRGHNENNILIPTRVTVPVTKVFSPRGHLSTVHGSLVCFQYIVNTVVQPQLQDSRLHALCE